MYQYEPKHAKKKAKKEIPNKSTYNAVPIQSYGARNAVCAENVIQRLPSFTGNPGLHVNGTNTAITLGDNDTFGGHNAIMIEGCDGHQGMSGSEIKHWGYVAHFTPAETAEHAEHLFHKKLVGVPGMIKRSAPNCYLESSEDYVKEGNIIGWDDEGAVNYFNRSYCSKQTFLINRDNAVAATEKVEDNIKTGLTYNLMGIGDKDCHNCATWAAGIMRTAGINIESTIFPHTVMKSAKKIHDDSEKTNKKNESSD